MTTGEQVYATTMRRAYAAARTVAWRHRGGDSDEFNACVVLAIPHVRWRDAETRIDFLAALERAAYLGFDPWEVEDRASFISVCYDAEIQAERAKGGE
jgi:hypothetical protein